MTSTTAAVRAGLARGRAEVRQTLTNGQDLWNYIFPSMVFLIVMFFMRDSTVPGTTFSLGSRTLPSVIGMGIAFGGLVTLMMQLAVEREDGTLLRAKAIPNGMLGYLIGKIVTVSGMTVVAQSIVLIPSLFMLDGITIDWFTLIWVMALGLVATLPLGAVAGSMFSNTRNTGIIMLPVMGLVAISGIFYPISAMPEWVQGLAQVFPIYWLGLGMRSAMLPDGLSAVEIGESWRHLEMLGVLGAWAAAGLIVAPMVLRRMARRESGSSVAERREKAMQRVT
ncbi:ABC transporter permease [Actinophytocola algeriensis]|uniref:ABC-2 type transport system permease protein n=1 Tax=Actinophytocola algeriensis TaxID=1768010 RepID=A0A7W7PZQ2_9PSEU|nr:ABC transporter permease [Actinophytocola algeriensis]MBB4904188.1 ABC-2 type transport system permease protein [Actinophytocola algeriensis]MBE1476955.1 ABC-2 type transport system permease protein [Actinophytocola algeriensis]